MDTAFCTNIFTTEEFPAAVERLGRLGYDGVEIWDRQLREIPISQIGQIASKAGVSVSQVCPYFDFTTSEEKAEESLRIGAEYVGFAVALGCKKIRTFTGGVGSREASDEQWTRASQCLRRICGMAQPHGIALVLETHPGSLMDTSAGTLKLLEMVGMPNLKINLQLPLFGEEIGDSVERLGEQVVHMHAHNWTGIKGKSDWAELTFLDSGIIDFRNLIFELRKRGFDGTISIEHGKHMGLRDPWEVAEHEIEYLRTLIADIR